MSARILVVDDEAPLRSLVASYVTKEGYEVREAQDGQEAVEVARDFQPDLVVLDLGLPKLDGIEVCRQIRTFSDCYIIMLTARSDEVDTIVGLSVGADDYVTKPFSPREVIARIKVMMRRPRAAGGQTGGTGGADEHPEPLRFGDLSVDLESREARLAGELIDLTRTEFDLLATMAEKPRRAFSRRQLIDEVWGDNWGSDDHLVDVHIVHLRRKLGDDAQTGRFVRTVRGVGYRMGDGS